MSDIAVYIGEVVLVEGAVGHVNGWQFARLVEDSLQRQLEQRGLPVGMEERNVAEILVPHHDVLLEGGGRQNAEAVARAVLQALAGVR